MNKQVAGAKFAGLWLSVLLGAACSGQVVDPEGTAPEQEGTGLIRLQLTQIPAGVQCLVLEASASGSDSSIFHNTPVKPNTNADITMGGLLPGKTVFVGRAYTNKCPPPAKATIAFISAPTVVFVNPGVAANLSLILQTPGSVTGTVDFEAGGAQCPSGQVLCSSGGKPVCTDLQSSRSSCGACGNACGVNQACVGGSCVAPGACSAGQFQCVDPTRGTNGPCSDHQSDLLNCGACGVGCLKTESCIAGKCTAPNSCTVPGQFQCVDPARGTNGPCSDHQSDVSNCGACGVGCLKTESCVAGKCTAPNSCTVPGQFQCVDPARGTNGPCSDHQSDVSNCGACGVVCSKTESCIAGKCTVPNLCTVAGEYQCFDPRRGSNGPCSDHLADQLNCGACGNVCLKTQMCRNGACQ